MSVVNVSTYIITSIKAHHFEFAAMLEFAVILATMYVLTLTIVLILCTLTLQVQIPLRRGVLDTTLCDKVCQ